MERMQELGASTTGGAEAGAAAAPGAAAQGSSAAPVARSREAMESAFGVGAAEMMAALSNDGVAGYPGRQTQELVAQAHGHWRACCAAFATAGVGSSVAIAHVEPAPARAAPGLPGGALGDPDMTDRAIGPPSLEGGGERFL